MNFTYLSIFDRNLKSLHLQIHQILPSSYNQNYRKEKYGYH